VAEHLGGCRATYDAIWVATGALEIGGRGPGEGAARPRCRRLGGAVRAQRHRAGAGAEARRAPAAARPARQFRGALGAGRLDRRQPGGGWYSYRASKAALNQIVRTAAIELARTHPELVCVALHPGTVRHR
jgi:NAD(P)-dependent dehydrogenase (short-subunit alcohol dehydrogenase family)